MDISTNYSQNSKPRQTTQGSSHEQIHSQSDTYLTNRTGKLQSECAKAVGVSQSQYSRLESGGSEWSVNQLYSISKFLNLSIEKILENAESMQMADNEIDTKVKEFSDKLESMTSLNDLIHRTLCRVIIDLHAEVGVISLLKKELLNSSFSQAVDEENASIGSNQTICQCGRFVNPHVLQKDCPTHEDTEFLCSCRGQRVHIFDKKMCAKWLNRYPNA